MRALMIAVLAAVVLAAVVLVGCAQPEEHYTGPKEGLSCAEAYKEVVNQNLCNQAMAEG